jgi:hypothetical protein
MPEQFSPAEGVIVRATFPLKPLTPVTVTVHVIEEPTGADAGVQMMLTVKSVTLNVAVVL